jgi:hypothetical protein
MTALCAGVSPGRRMDLVLPCDQPAGPSGYCDDHDTDKRMTANRTRWQEVEANHKAERRIEKAGPALLFACRLVEAGDPGARKAVLAAIALAEAPQ